MWCVEPAAGEAPAGLVSVLVLIELQSTVDRAMATRMLTYCALAWESLIGQGSSPRPGLVPTTLPVVFYNGASRWTASTRAGEVAWPSQESLGPYQATQRYALVDARALGAHDLPSDNRVSAFIEHIRDPNQLARVGGWLIECESASELLARLERLPRNG